LLDNVCYNGINILGGRYVKKFFILCFCDCITF